MIAIKGPPKGRIKRDTRKLGIWIKPKGPNISNINILEEGPGFKYWYSINPNKIIAINKKNMNNKIFLLSGLKKSFQSIIIFCFSIL